MFPRYKMLNIRLDVKCCNTSLIVSFIWWVFQWGSQNSLTFQHHMNLGTLNCVLYARYLYKVINTGWLLLVFYVFVNGNFVCCFYIANIRMSEASNISFFSGCYRFSLYLKKYGRYRYSLLLNFIWLLLLLVKVTSLLYTLHIWKFQYGQRLRCISELIHGCILTHLPVVYTGSAKIMATKV